MARVLVIDDDASVRTAIVTVLEHQGLDVIAVEDGQSGIEAVQRQKFDVIIVDIFMPGLDGLESIRAFKRHAPAVPVIAISGFMFRDSTRPAPDFLAMATKLGAAYSLHKPFRVPELLRLVEACLAPPPAAANAAARSAITSDPDAISTASDSHRTSPATPEPDDLPPDPDVIAAVTPQAHVIAAVAPEADILAAAPAEPAIVVEPALKKAFGT
jgi:CheY-like chemotaxis protein